MARGTRQVEPGSTIGERPARDLRPLFDPQSVAIVGASANPTKWGHQLAASALKGRHRRRVFLINRRGDPILGEPTYRSLSDVAQPIEMAVLAVGVAGFEEAVDDALRAGARTIVAITAGLGETGEPGRTIEQRAVERVRAAGAVMLGPNCLGIADASSELDLAWWDFPPGAIGLISQSGNLSLELALLAAEAGIGFSRMVSVGNQADLEAAELVDAFRQHADTQVIAVYLEDFRDGRDFARAAGAAVGDGKAVVLLTVGESTAGARAARSHTGALVSESAAIDAACRASGMIRVRTPAEVIDLARMLLMPQRLGGRRVAVLGDGGGHVAIAADRLAFHGLELPRLSDGLAAEISGVLPTTASTRNPVDMAGGGEQDCRNYERVVRLLADSGETDAILLTGYFGGYAQQSADFLGLEIEVAGGMAAAARGSRRPLIVQTMYPGSRSIGSLREAGVPVYADIEAATRSLGRLAARHDRPPTGVPHTSSQQAGPALKDGYFEARELVERAGVPVIEARPVTSLSEAHGAARALGFPVALKALEATHKSDAGGVRLGILNDDELTSAFVGLAKRLRSVRLSVERMAPTQDGVELLVGVRRDPRFGPIALVGFGGLFTEILDDVATVLAPVTRELAEELIRSLRGSTLLLGARGRPVMRLSAAAAAVAALSELAACRPEIAELEVNPLLVLPDRVVALDARLVLAQDASPA